jgi:hypothetical protein
MVDTASKTFTYTFSDTEWITVAWILLTYGPDSFDKNIKDYLASRTAQKNATELEEFQLEVKSFAALRAILVQSIDEYNTTVGVGAEIRIPGMFL